jgi:hypothetical protein
MRRLALALDASAVATILVPQLRPCAASATISSQAAQAGI